MLVMTLVAVAAAAAAWLRPLPEVKTPSAPAAPTFTDQQIADAKVNICDAFKIVYKSVSTNTSRTNPVPGDEIGALATGVYASLSNYTGGDYLMDRLTAEPATPAQLANSIKSLANALKKIAIIDLAGEPDSALVPLRQAINAEAVTIQGLCK